MVYSSFFDKSKGAEASFYFSYIKKSIALKLLLAYLYVYLWVVLAALFVAAVPYLPVNQFVGSAF
jgi:hypothetical protein